MMKIIVFLSAAKGISLMWTDGVTNDVALCFLIALFCMVLVVLDYYRSQNRTWSMVTGFGTLSCGFCALLEHQNENYGFIFVLMVLGAITNGVGYISHVYMQVQEKRGADIAKTFS